MLVKTQEFSFFLLFIVMFVFFSLYEKTNDITKTEKARRKYKHRRHVVINIAKNWKTLFNLIICSESDNRDLPDVYLKHEANANVSTNISDFRFQYNFTFEIDKNGLRSCPLLAPDLGPVVEDKAIWSLLGVEDMYSRIQPGGIYLPLECLALQEVAIIVPIHETRRFEYKFRSGKVKNISKPCPLLLSHLGPVADDKAIWSLFGIDNLYLRLEPGGIYKPANCMAIQQVAIVIPIHETSRKIIPYIGSFLYYIHPFLMKQQLEYQIFVILKPNATVPYKRGELFNIGFKEAQAYRPGGWDCIIFHDAHLVPLDTRNIYRCGHNPRKLIADMKNPYKFGGAVAMKPKHFIKANGFSNEIWSKDGDYIDMYKRLIAAHLTVETNVTPIGKYSYFEALRQENDKPQKSQTHPPNYLKDGLSTVSYTIKNCMRMKKFYTLIEVEVL